MAAGGGITLTRHNWLKYFLMEYSYTLAFSFDVFVKFSTFVAFHFFYFVAFNGLHKPFGFTTFFRLREGFLSINWIIMIDKMTFSTSWPLMAFISHQLYYFFRLSEDFLGKNWAIMIDKMRLSISYFAVFDKMTFSLFSFLLRGLWWPSSAFFALLLFFRLKGRLSKPSSSSDWLN